MILMYELHFEDSIGLIGDTSSVESKIEVSDLFLLLMFLLKID